MFEKERIQGVFWTPSTKMQTNRLSTVMLGAHSFQKALFIHRLTYIKTDEMTSKLKDTHPQGAVPGTQVQ